MSLKKFFTTILSFFFIVESICAIDWTERLPNDPHIVSGRLTNGITYYLRHNGEPRNRASFYIIRNAGALLEEDNQNGLAHFLEHMAFNGSLNFPAGSMVATLQRYGVSYGENLNAYTTQNETVYNISDVPIQDENVVDTCLLILHDWSYYLTLDAKDIDEERGVITEEWRSRNNSTTRIWKQKMPVMYKGSKYAERDVIGDMEIIKTFAPEDLREFYHKWYRTDLEAIVIVGDFDTSQMEEKVKTLFSSIPEVESPPQRPFFEIPDHDETYYCLATDKEASSSNIQLLRQFREPEYDGKGFATYNDMRNWLMMGFFNSMMSTRIYETIQKGNAPYVSASISFNETVRGYYSYSIFAKAKPGAEAEAFKGILEEHERVAQHGFTEAELERAKANLMTTLENALKDKNKTSNEDYAQELQSMFLGNNAVIYIDDYVDAAREIMPQITAQDVSSQVKRWWQPNNRVIIVSGPSDDTTHLNESEARKILAQTEGAYISPYQDNDTEGELIVEKPEPGKIEKTRKLDSLGAEEWTLSNGAKVVYRHVDYEKDEVSLYAYSLGGTSLYDNIDLLPAAKNAGAFVSNYGVGNNDNIALGRLLTGKIARCSVNIDELYETANGKATPNDFETMMQLLYLRFTAPRFDSIAHNVLVEKNRIHAKQTAGLPQTIMRDTVTRISTDYNPRISLFNEEYVDKLILDSMQKVYIDRIADASDFTFFIVGNVSRDSAVLMAQQYIAPIPSQYRSEQWIDRQIRGPEGKIEKQITLPLEVPKSTVLVTFNMEQEYNIKDAYIISLLGEILTTRYTRTIREEEGGTYGVGVKGDASFEPRGEYKMYMLFECDPDKAEQLKPLLYVEIDSIVQQGVTEEELLKVVKNALKELEQEKQHNSYYLNALVNYYKIGINILEEQNTNKLLESLTPKDIHLFAKKFFEKANIIDLLFVPE